MPRALALVALLGVVAPTSADLDIFFTPASAGYGLTDPTFDFKPTEGTQRDFDFYGLRGGNAPPVPTTTPLGMIDETCYLWVHFDGLFGWKIVGIHLNVTGAAIGDNAYYIMDDQKTWFDKRWDNAYTAGAPEFKMNPQVLIAVTAYGIQNKGASEPLWDPVKRTALLGAFKFPKSEVGKTAIAELGSLGIACYPSGPPPPRVRFTGIQIIPEPACLLLFGLVTVLIRRR
jgi:hypothetical protein